MSVSQKFVIQPKENPDRVLKEIVVFVRSLPTEKPWVVEIKRLVKERSNPQNAALWGCAYKYISTETGNDAEDLHTYFCGENFGWKVVDIVGSQKRKPIRTTTHSESGERDVISTEALSEFYDFIQRRCAEALGLQVPDPDPDWKKRMREKPDE